jgi:hypothetical protein
MTSGHHADPRPDAGVHRAPAEVFEDHLRLAQQHAAEEDIERNYAPDCVALTGRGVFRGHSGIRQLARMLEDELPEGRWHYRVQLVEGRAAYLEWSADAGDAVVEDGADSFVIENGQIVVQTIHYTVRDRDGNVLIGPDGRPPAA